MPDLYPLILQPKLTPVLWGGDALVRVYGKSGDLSEKLGESWECYDENAIVNGRYAGMTLRDVRGELGAALLGDLDPQRAFPILTKIIDAREALSVQVHPDDAYAQRVEGQPNGKTECWYIMSAEPGAELVLGWTRDTTRDEYKQRVADGSLGDILRRVPVEAGDAFYLPAGTLHAIGAGIVIFETQQTSDLTYRIFDWNRVGPDGKPRTLHIEKAADVLDYHESHAGALAELSYAYEGFQRTALIADPRFLVERVCATETAATMSTHGRPLILMSLAIALEIEANGTTVELPAYTTALVPAGCESVSIRGYSDGAEFMYVTPPASAEAIEKRLCDAGVAEPTIERFLSQFRSSETARSA